MKLDADEKTIFQLNPDLKILIPWFFAKTITYSLVVLLSIFTLLFFANTISVISNEHNQDNEAVETNVDKSETMQKDEEKKSEHPFELMVEYWMWAVVLTIFSMIAIQVYLIYLRKTYRYIITSKRCVFVGGILKRVERSVPYKKITDIQRTQNILERILGIWNIQIFTPGTASMAIGQRKAQAELNFDGLLNSEEALEAINKYMQECS